MNIGARKHYRKQKIKQQNERDIKAVIDKALKRFGGSGRLFESPEAQISALERYIADLEQIAEEMESQYGPDVHKIAWQIKADIRKSIKAIAKVKMAQAKPD